MSNLYNVWKYEVLNSSSKEKTEICKACTNYLYDYFKNIYGEDAARELLWSTVLIIAGNDGIARHNEMNLYNYCFGDNYKYNYDSFCQAVKKYRNCNYRKDWEVVCKRIDDENAYKCLVSIMLCVASIDGEITSNEENYISPLCDQIEYNNF